MAHLQAALAGKHHAGCACSSASSLKHLQSRTSKNLEISWLHYEPSWEQRWGAGHWRAQGEGSGGVTAKPVTAAPGS